MSLLDFESSGPAPRGGKKSLKLVLGIGALTGVIALGSTLAANINLNGGGNVEFGQGFVTTTACDDDGITVTPFSAFINAQGGGEHKLSSIRLSGIDSREDNCEGKTFRIRAYGEGSDPLNLFNWTERDNNGGVVDEQFYDFVDITRTATDFLWTSGGTDNDDVIDINESNIEQTAFTLDLVSLPVDGPAGITRTPLVFAEDVKRITVETFDALQITTAYSVGDIGPGGGVIFYVAETPFVCGPSMNLTCTYLEAAPTTGTNAWVDSNYYWSGNVVDAIGANARGTDIGTGYRNTLAIVGQAGGGDLEDRAATDARAYRGPNDLRDWFIPSLDELTMLFENRAITNISNSFDDFWSSTELDASHAFIEWFGGAADVYPNEKGSPNAVRPIRAF
jgi:hypothetical protein